MKAEELRIGNYFQWKSIASMGRGVDQITSGQQIDQYPDFKEPIPLSPEWLGRLGFKKMTLIRYEKELPFNGYYAQTLVFVLGDAHIMENHDLNRQCKIGPCKSLHQLQNIFHALTGEELTLKP